ncbi:MAG: hypothetical protein ACLGG0_05175 [Bacteriovoracia bacterium]
MRSSIFLVLLSLLFVSCAQKSSQVSLKLSSSFAFGGASLASYSEGGLMVWGMSGDGKSFGKVLNDTDSLTLDLPNGDWKFYAMAWDTSTSIPMSTATGAARCAQSLPIKLDGAPQAPALVMTVTNCNDVMFKGTLSGSIASTMLRLRACESVDGILADSDACTNDRTDINRKSDKAPVMSARIRLADYGNGVGVAPGEGLSRCIQMTNGVSGQWMTPGPGTLFIPSGDPTRPAAVPFRVEVEFFYNSVSCTDANPSKIVLPNSFVSTTPGKKHFFSGTSEYVLSIAVPDSMVCGNGRATATPFAGGDGTDNFPFLICSAPQLFSIHDGVAGRYGSSYRLSADINLSNYRKGIASDTIMPAVSECWEMGQSWQPIGTTFTAAPSCSPSTVEFTKSFDGNKHRISGMNMRMESSSDVGFIASWNPTIALDEIRELNFFKPSVSAFSRVGTVIGQKPAASTTQNYLRDIEIYDAEVEARSQTLAQVGGVVGYGNRLSLENVKSLRSRVYTEGTRSGGIFGEILDAQKIKNVHSRSIVKYRYSGAMTDYMGGVGGQFSSNTMATNGFQAVSHEGAVVSSGSFVGGLIGSLGTVTGSSITHFYVVGGVTSTNTGNTDIGGVFGASTYNGYVDAGYFLGHISHQCTTTCNVGRVVGGQGGTNTTGSLVVVTNDLIAAAGTGDGSLTITPVTYTTTGNLFDAAYLPGSFATAPYVHVAGDLPRFVTEQHPCSATGDALTNNRATVANQISGGRGTATRPITICHKDQFMGMSGVTNRVAHLQSAVVLTGAYTPIDVAAGTVLDGSSGILVGYVREGTMGTIPVDRAPILSNSGTIQNLSLANIHSNATTLTNPGGTVAGFLTLNTSTGVVRNVAVESGEIGSQETTTNIHNAGMVIQNDGLLENIEFDALLKGRRQTGGLVYTNSNTLRSSWMSGTFNLTAATNELGGVVYNNLSTGLIEKVTVESVLETTFTLNQMAIVAHTNTGTIRDVDIESSSRWRFPSTNFDWAIVALNNTGTIQRVVNKGQMYNEDYSIAGIAAQTGKAVKTGAGTVQSFMNLSPAGRLLYTSIGTNVGCAGSQLTINAGYYVSGLFDGGGSYWDAAIGSSKFVWLVVENQGDTRLARATNLAGTLPLRLDLSESCASLGITSMDQVKLVQDYDSSLLSAQGDITIAPFKGVKPGQNLTIADFDYAGSPWFGQVLDESDPADLDLILDYYAALLAGQTAPNIVPWQLGDYGPELISIDK